METPPINPFAPSPEAFAHTGKLPDVAGREPLGSGVVTALLSRGGSSLVYEIWNQQLEVKRAIKLLDPDHLDESLERFETEIKISAKLHHPHIVEIFNVGLWNNLPYIEMERIDGKTIEELLAARGALPVEVCTAVGIMIAKALNYAHNLDYMVFGREYRGVIHRDIKPANIMVQHASGIAKLMDFGIAKPVNALSRTMEGMVVGTMAYLAPEQLKGGEVDQRADLYAFGSVLYEMLTGRKTFPEENLARLVTDKLSSNYLDISIFRIACPSPLKKLLGRCLAFDRKNRLPDAATLVRRLIAIHTRLTDLSPEEVLRLFLAQTSLPRQTVGLRWLHLSPRSLVRIPALVLLLSGVGYLWLTLQTHTRITPREAIVHPLREPAAARDDTTTTPPPPTRERYSPPSVPRPPSVPPSPVQRKPAPSAPIAGPPPPAPPPRLSPLQQLHQRHGSNDNTTLLRTLTTRGAFRDALRVWELLPRSEQSDTENALWALRALQGLNDNERLSRFLAHHPLDDAEFHGARALMLAAQGSVEAAREALQRCMRTPGRLSDPDALEDLRVHARAAVATAAFEREPTGDHRTEAMDAWYELKLRFRNRPNNTLFTRADTLIRRIAAHP